jgi:hypothetical protein
MYACTSVNSESNNNGDVEEVDCNGGNWLVPCQQVVDGGPGVDGIPSIDVPNFSEVQDIQFLEDWELVLGVKKGNEVKAYPHVILYYHEIVNDHISESPLAVTFCPLTGSGIGWSREINGNVSEFGVSGLIHKNNLIPYDRETGSRWSQMLGKSINGELIGKEIKNIQIIEMTWGAWKKAFPNSLVLNTNTGYQRDYEKYLYGEDYSDDNSRILFPVYQSDERLDAKTLIHGIHSESNSKVYPVDGFDSNIEVLNDEFEGKKILVAGSSRSKLAVSYSRTLSDGTVAVFESSQNALPVIATDLEGNTWNVFGEAINGPRKGEKLEPTGGYNAYWFAWSDFFNFPQIYRFN